MQCSTFPRQIHPSQAGQSLRVGLPILIARAARPECTAQAPGEPISVSHLFCRLYTIRSVIGAEGEPGGGEVGHSAEADPEGLGAGWEFLGSVVVAAQLGQQAKEI